MDDQLKTIIGEQFGAAIDMLENAIRDCPDNLWKGHHKFYPVAHHTVFFLDYYLSESPKEAEYVPPPPFTRAEFEDNLPPRHPKEDLLRYLNLGRQKLRKQLAEHTVAQLQSRRFVSEYKDFSLFELLLYNMRHVQHHAAQLNLLLRQEVDLAPKWVSKSKDVLR